MLQLETQLAKPNVAPAVVALAVSGLASDTVEAPRNLSTVLMNRLNAIASQHHGRVPLHGRLFAQWMHHVYPRECQYPHVAGTVNHKNVFEWVDEKGIQALSASKQEIEHYTSNATTPDTEIPGAAMQPSLGVGSAIGAPGQARTLMWTTEEELVVSTTVPPQRGGIRSFCGRVLASLVVLGSICMSLRRSLGPALFASAKGTFMLPMAQRRTTVEPLHLSIFV